MYYITFAFDSKVESILEEQVGKKHSFNSVQ